MVSLKVFHQPGLPVCRFQHLQPGPEHLPHPVHVWPHRNARPHPLYLAAGDTGQKGLPHGHGSPWGILQLLSCHGSQRCGLEPVRCSYIIDKQAF